MLRGGAFGQQGQAGASRSLVRQGGWAWLPTCKVVEGGFPMCKVVEVGWLPTCEMVEIGCRHARWLGLVAHVQGGWGELPMRNVLEVGCPRGCGLGWLLTCKLVVVCCPCARWLCAQCTFTSLCRGQERHRTSTGPISGRGES